MRHHPLPRSRRLSLWLCPLLLAATCWSTLAPPLAVAGSPARVARPTSADDRANAATVRIRCERILGARRQTSSGAGVILTEDGYIATAFHVVRDYEVIQVTTAGGEVLPAQLVHAERAIDIALLKVEPQGSLVVATLAGTTDLRPGVQALVIGNPHGLGQTMVRGTIGSMAVVAWEGVRAPLQAVHARIVRGNSGGGTYDAETGVCLGINVAKASSADNVGYMVPATRLAEVFDRAVASADADDAQRIYRTLGVRLRPVRIAAGQFSSGVMVTAVKVGGIAQAAGWKPGDILVGLDKYQMIDRDAVLYVLEDPERQSATVKYLVARGERIESGYVTLAGDSFRTVASAGRRSVHLAP